MKIEYKRVKEITAKVISPFDDPVGHWCECKGCNEMFFVPTRDYNSVVYTIKYCPKCGNQVINIEKILTEGLL